MTAIKMEIPVELKVKLVYSSHEHKQYIVLLTKSPQVEKAEQTRLIFIPDIRLHSLKVFGSKQKINAPPGQHINTWPYP